METALSRSGVREADAAPARLGLLDRVRAALHLRDYGRRPEDAYVAGSAMLLGSAALH